MDITHSMSAYECYREYLALKQHFTKPGYDYHKFNGKLRVSPASYEKRRDKLYFQKLSRHEDPRGLIVSNMLRDPKVWAKELAYSELAERTFREWQRRRQSLTYQLASEVRAVEMSLDDWLSCGGGHPRLLRDYMAGRVCLETVVAVTGVTGCMRYWSHQLTGDPVAEGELMRIEKYRSFLSYDAGRVRDVLLDHFSAYK